MEAENEHLVALLFKITQADTRNRNRRNSKGPRMAIISADDKPKYLAWCCPDYFDKDLVSQSFLVHIQDLSFVYPHNKLWAQRIEDEKSWVFSLKLAAEGSRLRDWVIHSAFQWAYISADAFSALSSKGKSIQLPWSVPSASSGFSCSAEVLHLEDVPDSSLDADSGEYFSFRLHFDDLHFFPLSHKVTRDGEP